MNEIPRCNGEDIGAGDHARALALHQRLGLVDRLEALWRQVPVFWHVPLHRRRTSRTWRYEYRRITTLHVPKRRLN